MLHHLWYTYLKEELNFYQIMVIFLYGSLIFNKSKRVGIISSVLTKFLTFLGLTPGAIKKGTLILSFVNNISCGIPVLSKSQPSETKPLLYLDNHDLL